MKREIIGDAILYCGDCLDVAAELEAASIDALVSDPPYGLEFMGKDWDRGVPGVHFWAEFLRVVKPGAHLLAFGGTRTFHRQVVAIEDAGWQIRDQLGWLYGSGFPKSLDVSKAIDRSVGAEREVVGRSQNGIAGGSGEFTTGNARSAGFKAEFDITAPATDDAKTWSGWGTALKPAWEPICLARKPLVGTVAGNVLRYGTGAINVDGCRVGDEARFNESAGNKNLDEKTTVAPISKQTETFGRECTVRWPANILHDGSDEVVALFPSEAGGGNGAERLTFGIGGNGIMGGGGALVGSYSDSGSAARFFYTAKASREDRDEGLEVMRLASAGEITGGRLDGSAGLNNPRAGAGRTAGGRNVHPTVKPTDLMRWCVRLIAPVQAVVFDPFMGSGSTGKAAMLEGRRFVGAELSPEYFDIACRRIEAAYKEAQRQPTLFDELRATGRKAADILQPSFF